MNNPVPRTHRTASYPLEDFIEWRRAYELTQDAAAYVLGYQTRQIKRWEAGEVRIPYAVGLACAAVAKNMRPWRKALFIPAASRVAD